VTRSRHHAAVSLPDEVAAAVADLRLLPARLERPTSLTDVMAQAEIPGVGLAVVADGGFAWAGGFGVRSSQTGDRVNADTMFQAGSISKPVAALCALKLVADGTLDLDEDVNERLTSWRVPPVGGWTPRVTLRQLLSHTAGLTVHGFPGYHREVAAPALVDVLDGRGNTPAVLVRTIPGLQFSYSGGGYCVLQQLLVDVTGQPFPELARALVLEPLGMANSTYEQPLPEARRRQAAIGHRTAGRPVDGGWHVYPEMAAAGLWTTPSDLARVVVAVQRARAGEADALLPASLVGELLSPQAPNVPMGLGLLVDGDGATRRFRHGGDDQGFVAALVGYAELGIGAVVMTNSDQGQLAFEPLLAALARAYGWRDYPDADEPGPRRSDPAELDACIGSYGTDGGHRLQLERAGDGLALRVPGQQPIPLTPIWPSGWGAAGLQATVHVQVDDDGRATGIRLAQNAAYVQDVTAERLDS
jgi:CubicO group peptidase (beta-lactamase class C family)